MDQPNAPTTLSPHPEDGAERIGARVRAMAQVFGLSAGEVMRDGHDWRDMLDTCSACVATAPCARLLAKGARANPRDAGFCPNRHRFAAHWADS